MSPAAKLFQNRIKPEFRDRFPWAMAALRRDNYTCQGCGERYKNLVVHHIDGGRRLGYKEMGNSLENLISLCRRCHSKIHNQYLYPPSHLETPKITYTMPEVSFRQRQMKQVQKKEKPVDPRIEVIETMLLERKHLREIGSALGISGERVRQIIKKQDLLKLVYPLLEPEY